LTLSATVDNENLTANFDVEIKDPCSTAIFKTSPSPLVSMNVSLPSNETIIQTVVILTDV
jgi:hypothetical protein